MFLSAQKPIIKQYAYAEVMNSQAGVIFQDEFGTLYLTIKDEVNNIQLLELGGISQAHPPVDWLPGVVTVDEDNPIRGYTFTVFKSSITLSNEGLKS